uniref:Vinculin n=1 Tax=Schistocephalus solidus TaxID=70667 RepID=A0A183SS34_SCHSO
LAASNLIDPWRGDALQALASNLESVGGQVSLAGQAVVSARRTGASSQLLSAASDHLDLVKRHWTDCAERTRNLVDEAVDANAFIRAQESRILQDTERTEDSVDQRCPTTVVNSTTSIALRANRVLQVAIKETENSEDAVYVDRVNEAVQRLRSTITPMVTDAKNMVLSLEDPAARDRWRVSSKSLVAAVDNVGRVVVPSYLSGQFRDSMTPYPPRFHGNDTREPAYDTPNKELQQLTLRTANGSAKEQASFRYPNGSTTSADEASYTFRPEVPLPIRSFPLQSRILKIHGPCLLPEFALMLPAVIYL